MKTRTGISNVLKFLLSVAGFALLMRLKFVFDDYLGRLKTEITPKVSTTFKSPEINLDAFSTKHKNTLFEYLVKSREWHVFPQDGKILAMRRSDSNFCSSFKDRYVTDEQRRAPFFEEIFFDLDPSKPMRLNYPTVKNKLSGNGSFPIRLSNEEEYYSKTNNPKIPPVLSGYLIFESRDRELQLYTYEHSRDINRQFTTKSLTLIAGELEKLGKHIKGDRNIDASILPPKSVIISDLPILSVKESIDNFPGKYDISGYVNPGEKGSISLKIINNNQGKVIDLDGGKQGDWMEYVGWSSNPQEKFNFCIKLFLGGHPDDPNPIEAEFQVWFQPADNSPKRMLTSKIAQIYMFNN